VPPISDGAAAVVLAREDLAAKAPNPAFIRGIAYCAEADNGPARSMLISEPLAQAARVVYRASGITSPRRQFDVVEVQEPYSCFELSYYESLGLTKAGGAAELITSGATQMTGDIPVNPSGGCLGANPIGAAGLIRMIEVAMQVTNRAGAHQIKGAKLGVAQTGGGWANLRGVAVISND
jgi:acetyl-CoA C-acetyltransferase